MKLYNTKTKEIELFKSIHENEVMMYLCGPTVYNHPHIGNARPIVVFDLLRRILEALDYKVKFVSNYTDVDDRIIEKARLEGVEESVISERYIDAYESVRLGLNAHGVNATPKVTENMQEIIDFIDELIRLDFAYENQGDVYFRVNKIKDYGEISSQNIEALKIGARIEENMQKESSLDFVLWKKTDDEGIKWDSPWGFGRPGWHTECVVMIQDEFETDLIDIHGGGVDLKFPHHENESAQSKALHNHDIANYWVHNAMVNIDGEKMSKSLGNVTWAKDYIDTFGTNVTRLLLLSTHYRLILNLSAEVIQQVQKEVLKFETVYKQVSLKFVQNSSEFSDLINDELKDQFMDCMKDDMNVANAMVGINDLVKKINQDLRKPFDKDVLSESINTLSYMFDILGLQFNITKYSEEQIKTLNLWDKAKKEKDFESADKYRQTLIDMGVL